MDQDEDWILLRYGIETTAVTDNLFTVCYGFEAEAAKLVILNIESSCRSHDFAFAL
jgi:hypothetical protein